MDTVSAVRRFSSIKSAADHASGAHKGQYRKDWRTPYIVHPARVAGYVSMFGGSHVAIISAWLHDVYDDCTPEWISLTDSFISVLPLTEDEQQEIAAIVDALTKKNTLPSKSARLSDSIGRILDAPPEATLVKICDRIDNFLDTADRDGQVRKRYLVSTDEIIDRLSVRADFYGYEKAMNALKEIRYASLKNE